MFIKIKKLSDKAVIPEYKTELSAGMDLTSTENVTLQPGEWKLISTGLAIQIEKDFEAQVRPRSGLALKHGVTVLNSPGTIDADYRGEIKILLINHGKAPFQIEEKMRIAQMVISKVYQPKINETDTLEDTDRNTKGFGSTGLF